MGVYLTEVLICISLWLSSHVLIGYSYFFCEDWIFCLLKKKLGFLIEFFIYSGFNFLCQIYIFWVFSLNLWLAFIFLMVPFESRSFNFDELQLIICFLLYLKLFMSCPRNLCLPQGCKGFLLFFLWKFYSFRFYMAIYDSFWVNLCHVLKLFFFLFAFRYSIVLGIFVEKIILSSLHCLCAFVNNQLSIYDAYISGLSILFHWSIRIFLHHHAILNSVVLWYILKSCSTSPSTLFFCKVVLTNLCLCVPMLIFELACQFL